jgi:hypothetical protein
LEEDIVHRLDGHLHVAAKVGRGAVVAPEFNDRQAGTRIVWSSVRQIRVSRRHERESQRATKHLRRIVPDENLFAHSEQGKRRAIVAVFELKKEIPD